MIVSNCGEIKSGDDWGYYDNDISSDELPPFPDDWEQKTYDFTVMLSKGNPPVWQIPHSIPNFAMLNSISAR